MILLPLFLVPTLFVAATLFISLKRRSDSRRAGVYALAAYILFFLFGAYSILKSRSSTAAIGFVFLPCVALVPGLLGLALGKVHGDYLKSVDGAGSRRGAVSILVILITLLLLPFAWQTYELVKTVQKNRDRDREAERQAIAIQNYRKELNDSLAAHPGNESAILSERAAQTDDRTVLIPIAESTFASEDLLATLSRSSDLGVVLTVVRNKNTAGSTLEWIYRHHTYPFYFYMDLSGNSRTPEAILRELYSKRAENSGITWNLARNPNVPDDILTNLAQERDPTVLKEILNRSQLTCGQLKRVIAAATVMKMNDSAWLLELAQNQSQRCSTEASN